AEAVFPGVRVEHGAASGIENLEIGLRRHERAPHRNREAELGGAAVRSRSRQRLGCLKQFSPRARNLQAGLVKQIPAVPNLLVEGPIRYPPDLTILADSLQLPS